MVAGLAHLTYAEWLDVEVGFRPLSAEERDRCAALLAEAALIIDAYNPSADADRKRLGVLPDGAPSAGRG